MSDDKPLHLRINAALREIEHANNIKFGPESRHIIEKVIMDYLKAQDADALRALLAEAATVFAYIREADKGEVVLDPAIYVVVMHKDVIDQALDLLQRIQQAIPRSSSEAR